MAFTCMGWTRRLRKPAQKPWLLEVRSSKSFILCAVSLAVFADIFLYAVLVPVVPFALNSHAGVQEQQVQKWVAVFVAIYGGAAVIISPICGYLSDQRPSRRPGMLLGMLVVIGATILLQVGSSISVLIAGRVLQGAAAAIIWTIGLALLVDTVGQRDIGMAMGVIGLAMACATLLSPILGGIVFEKAGYNTVFGMCYVLLGVDLVLRLLIIERKEAAKYITSITNARPTSVSTKSSWTTCSTTSSSPSIVEVTDCAVTTSKTMAPPKVSVVTMLPRPLSSWTVGSEDGNRKSLVVYSPTRPLGPLTEYDFDKKNSKRSRHRPAMVTLLTSRRLLAALWAIMVQAILLTSFDATLPIFVRETFGWNSIGAGLIFVPLLLPSFLSPLIGGFADRYGSRELVTAGFVLATPHLVLLRFVVDADLSSKALMCVLLTLLGLSFSFIMGPMMAEMSWVVETKEAASPGLLGNRGAFAQAYGLLNMAYAAGSLAGPLWAGLIKEKAGWDTMAWSLALLSAVTAVPTVLFCGGWLFDRAKRRRNRDNTNKAEEKFGSDHVDRV